MSPITGNYVDLRQLRKLHLILHDITDHLFQSNFQKYPDKYIPIYRIDMIQKGPVLLKILATLGAGKMAPWLTTLAALPRHQGLVSSTHMATHKHL